MPADVPIDRRSTQELCRLRDELKVQRRAQVKAGKPLPLFEHATTNNVIRMAGELEDHLLTFKTVVGQWLINMDRMGAEKFVQQDRRPRLAPERRDPRQGLCDRPRCHSDPHNRRHRMQILAKVIAVVTLPVMLTACAVNIDKAIAEFSKPKVAFATPAAWRCDADAMKGPGKHGVESCDRCSTTGKTLETVTINGDPHSVAPKANVLICQTQAMVE